MGGVCMCVYMWWGGGQWRPPRWWEVAHSQASRVEWGLWSWDQLGVPERTKLWLGRDPSEQTTRPG